MDFYQWLLVAEFLFAGLVFVLLFFLSAPYGKFYRTGWGPTVPPKWGWMIMELPAVLIIGYWFFQTEDWNSPVVFFLLMWQVHYVFRSLVYPFFAGSRKPYPVLLIMFALVFNCVNGYINGKYVFSLHVYHEQWLLDPRFMLGFLLFFFGYVVNKQSDRILARLRKSQSSYGVPRGGFFKYVSNPHYLGEIIQWAGWAIATWSLPGLAFAVFTFANLAPRAISAHKWYRGEFRDYPKNRKALIPFIW